MYIFFFFFFQAEDGIRDADVTGVQTCALPIRKGGRIATCARDFSSPHSTIRNSARRAPTRSRLNNGGRDGSSNSPYCAPRIRSYRALLPCRRAGEIAARPNNGDNKGRKFAGAKAGPEAGAWLKRNVSGHARNAAFGRLPERRGERRGERQPKPRHPARAFAERGDDH